ncbi:hypothetical protein HDV00_007553 [Rhizophlyctis rosea]|nr:hypothetical protein HDV00_007553 [Rhizophlyctis rosea]
MLHHLKELHGKVELYQKPVPIDIPASSSLYERVNNDARKFIHYAASLLVKSREEIGHVIDQGVRVQDFLHPGGDDSIPDASPNPLLEHMPMNQAKVPDFGVDAGGAEQLNSELFDKFSLEDALTGTVSTLKSYLAIARKHRSACWGTGYLREALPLLDEEEVADGSSAMEEEQQWNPRPKKLGSTANTPRTEVPEKKVAVTGKRGKKIRK